MDKNQPPDRINQAMFYSHNVLSSYGAAPAPIEMTGERDVERQDWELRVIFGTRPELPGDAEQYVHGPEDAITD